ncbi:MAG TPA: polysaccharide biosynthesis/export family protein [Polyangiaceae bacterium]|nr:polysaccharide biosynthesis/export family protein [Polyangiaceae bacterium]
MAYATVLVAMSGCASQRPFVWFRDLPPTERMTLSGQLLIGVGDTVSIRVYEQPTLATDGKIRADGKIALLFIGEVVAAGKAPGALAQEIEIGLQKFIVSPRVTVNVVASPPVSVSVLGEVSKQGMITLEPPAGLLQALAQCGGPSEYADKSAIFVLRRLPEFHRIRFTYDALVRNEDGAASFPLQNGDVLLVQ